MEPGFSGRANVKHSGRGVRSRPEARRRGARSAVASGRSRIGLGARILARLPMDTAPGKGPPRGDHGYPSSQRSQVRDGHSYIAERRARTVGEALAPKCEKGSEQSGCASRSVASIGNETPIPPAFRKSATLRGPFHPERHEARLPMTRRRASRNDVAGLLLR